MHFSPGADGGPGAPPPPLNESILFGKLETYRIQK